MNPDDPWDPSAERPGATTGQGDLSQNQTLKQAIESTDTYDCVDCPECGFLRDGWKSNASFPFRPAMDYQERVVRLLGMSNPPFAANIDAKQIEEWTMPDAASGTGRRPFDGLNGLRCFLIEAKLGYAGYLVDDFGAGAPEIADSSRAEERMGVVQTQITNHHNLASRYPSRHQGLDHMVAWGCSQTLLALFVNSRAGSSSRVRAFNIPAAMLPQSIW